MKTETELREEIAATQDAYRAAVHTLPAAEWAPLAKKVSALQAELHAVLADGATGCAVCKTAPRGMLKTPAVFDKFGNMKSGPVYEVGCNCTVVDNGDGSKTMPGAQGATPADAVKAWNKGKRVRKASSA